MSNSYLEEFLLKHIPKNAVHSLNKRYCYTRTQQLTNNFEQQNSIFVAHTNVMAK